jgi:hypothetical protein
MITWTDPGIFQPEELDLLQQVFDEACQKHGVTSDTEARESLAEAIVRRYRAGTRDRENLVLAWTPAPGVPEPSAA